MLNTFIYLTFSIWFHNHDRRGCLSYLYSCSIASRFSSPPSVFARRSRHFDANALFLPEGTDTASVVAVVLPVSFSSICANRSVPELAKKSAMIHLCIIDKPAHLFGE
jgi:hypothetical protein